VDAAGAEAPAPWGTNEGMLLPPPTSPAQKLTGSYYGTTVAISGDLLAMGGPQADATAQQDGGVLVFSMQNGSWTYRTTLTAAGAASYDYLGTGLDIDNGTVLAGAPGHDALGSNVGAAYLFTIPISDPNNQPPQPTFSAKRERLTVHLDASLSRDPDGTIVSYDWDFGDGNSGSGVNTSCTYSSSGTYTIRLTVTDNGGATANISLNLTVSDTNMLPKASFTATTNWLSVSLKASGSYDPDGQLVSYSWSFGDGNGGSGHSVSHTYAAAGTYTITLTVTDNEGGESSASQAVTVNDPQEISLTATGYKVRNLQKVDLVWSGATSAQVDVYFSSKLQSEFWGVLVATVPNTGTYTHHVDRTRGTTYKHWVCEAGTDKCSNKTEVVFY
jgi:large repetitive protein